MSLKTGEFYHEIDNKWKDYVIPMARLVNERFKCDADVRYCKEFVQFHFVTHYRRFRDITFYLDGFIAALKYNRSE